MFQVKLNPVLWENIRGLRKGRKQSLGKSSNSINGSSSKGKAQKKDDKKDKDVIDNEEQNCNNMFNSERPYTDIREQIK